MKFLVFIQSNQQIKMVKEEIKMKVSPGLRIFISTITIIALMFSYLFMSVLLLFYVSSFYYYLIVGLIGGAMLLAIFKFNIVQSNAVKASFISFPIITIYIKTFTTTAPSENYMFLTVLASLGIVGGSVLILYFLKASWEYYVAIVGWLILLVLMSLVLLW